MPSQVLTFLKYIFLVVLYLFFVRVLRAVWTELREPQPVSVSPLPAPDEEERGKRRFRRGGGRDRGGDESVERLAIEEPPARAGQWFDLGEELTLGRAPTCGVSLPEDTFVSSRHARVFRRDGRSYVEDLGSTNGTFLNDTKVTAPAPLHPGDRLKVGRTVMELTR